MTDFLAFPDRDALAKGAAAAIEAALRQRMAQPGHASLALSGGRTPGLLTKSSRRSTSIGRG
jgi:6-phosphogluconolactonase/glucosamine-6-phosphate isomerase/deaminase